MKRFKQLFILIVCALCVCLCFAFAGCNDKSYVEGSFEYTIKNYGVMYDLDGEFKIKPEKSGKYKVSYTITTEGDCGKQKKDDSNFVNVVAGEETTVYIHLTFEMVDGKVNNDAYISNIKVKLIDSDNDEKDPDKKEIKDAAYAIGFGVTGGVLLIAAVTVFVLDKCGVFKKKN